MRSVTVLNRLRFRVIIQSVTHGPSRFLRFAVLSALLALLAGAGVARAETYVNEFPVSDALRGRVDFWKLVFTKYGKNEAVFHHRDYPEIIYSVLDFSRYQEVLPPKAFAKERARILDRETDQIKQALLSLAKGRAPSSELEQRIKELFQQHGIDNSRSYRDAATDKQIRSQTGIRERFQEGIQRSGRYLHAIEQIFEQADLPKGLSRLPLVESSFDYNAYSSAGAAGIWQ
ncbi:MAG: hypothetical protein KDD44_05200, partial [Bdellovibrionales bacterium]|nr:hypothetical protein [Bdellovibrionales bacterium]